MDKFKLVGIKDENNNVEIVRKHRVPFLKKVLKNKKMRIVLFTLSTIMLMSVLTPLLFSNRNQQVMSRVNLPPRVFNTQIGFLDGCTVYENMIYDVKNQSVVGVFKDDGIVEESFVQSKVGDYYTNEIKQGAFGGSIILENKSDEIIYFNNNYPFTIQSNDNVIVSIDIENDTSSLYRIVVIDNDVEEVLLDWNTLSGVYDFELNEMNNCYIKIELQANSNITINSLNISSDNNELNELLEQISITDASETLISQILVGDKLNPQFWKSNGDKTLFNANIIYCSFVYDHYNAAIGLKNKKIDLQILNKYIELGYCEYDVNIGITSFKVLDERCPIETVNAQSELLFYGEVLYEFTVDSYLYKEQGFTQMPKFILGTDNNGRDIITITFTGLKTSLIMAFCASAICFIIGLIWGSVSGFYGGYLDLILERIIDVIKGVPWTVIMTLTILFLGRSVIAFVIAVCLTNWIMVANRTRTQMYRYKKKEYILASKALGSSDKRIIFKHLLPNSIGTIITTSILMIPGFIFTEASLSYLGLGIENQFSLGSIISENQYNIYTYPALTLFPVIILAVIMICFNIIGEVLRESLDTKN